MSKQEGGPPRGGWRGVHSTHTLRQAALRAALAVQPTDQRENIYTYVINATEVGLALLHLDQQQMQ